MQSYLADLVNDSIHCASCKEKSLTSTAGVPEGGTPVNVGYNKTLGGEDGLGLALNLTGMLSTDWRIKLAVSFTTHDLKQEASLHHQETQKTCTQFLTLTTVAQVLCCLESVLKPSLSTQGSSFFQAQPII